MPEQQQKAKEESEKSKKALYKYEWKTANGYTYQFKNIPEMLRKIMQHIEETRNDDTKLRHVVWRRVQELDLNDWEDFQKTANAETIRRSRQQIQSEGDHLPTDPEVLYRRNFTVEEVADCYEIRKPRVPHNYLNYLGEKVEDEDLSEEKMEEKYLGDLDGR